MFRRRGAKNRQRNTRKVRLLRGLITVTPLPRLLVLPLPLLVMEGNLHRIRTHIVDAALSSALWAIGKQTTRLRSLQIGLHKGKLIELSLF